MNKRLDDILGIASDTESEVKEKKEVLVVDNKPDLLVSDMDQHLINLSDVTSHERDMDALAEKAMEGYEEIMEFARDSDPRNVGHVLAAAVSMQGNAIAAKESKMKAKLQAANLLLRKKAMDDKKPLQDATVLEEDDEGNVTGDRNKILSAIKNLTDQ